MDRQLLRTLRYLIRFLLYLKIIIFIYLFAHQNHIFFNLTFVASHQHTSSNHASKLARSNTPPPSMHAVLKFRIPVYTPLDLRLFIFLSADVFPFAFQLHPYTIIYKTISFIHWNIANIFTLLCWIQLYDHYFIF